MSHKNKSVLGKAGAKVFVLDTSVLIHDPLSIYAFQDNVVVIPIIVVKELDGLKNKPDIGYDAREVSRCIDSMIKESANIKYGVPIGIDGGMLYIDLDGDASIMLPSGFDPNEPDNVILLTAMRLQKESENRVILVSKDTNLRILARSLGVLADDYNNDKVASVEKLYTGFTESFVADDVISRLYQAERSLIVSDSGLTEEAIDRLVPNICCRLIGQNTGKSALAIFNHTENTFDLVEKPSKHKRDGINPRNEEQALAYALATNPNIEIMTLSGKAGTGKSLIALKAGYEQLGKSNGYDRMCIFRPTREIGEPLGFLPGTLEEKFAPWQRPILSNLQLIIEEGESRKSDYLESLITDGKIEILPINYLRGATIHKAFVIVDEAQNMTPHEMKTVVTRAGERSKLVINGDLFQVDGKFLDKESNGLAHVIHRFPGQDTYGHLRLTKGERSRLAELAASLL